MSGAVARQQQCAAGMPARRSSASSTRPGTSARHSRSSTYCSYGLLRGALEDQRRELRIGRRAL